MWVRSQSAERLGIARVLQPPRAKDRAEELRIFFFFIIAAGLSFSLQVYLSRPPIRGMTKPYDVIIAGAGPVGLFLACELGLRRVSVLVLERDMQQESPWKVEPLGLRSLNTQSVEAFYRRGLLGKLINLDERPKYIGKKPGFQFGGHFAGIKINANQLDLDRWKYRLPGPALSPGPTSIDQVEKVLRERKNWA